MTDIEQHTGQLTTLAGEMQSWALRAEATIREQAAEIERLRAESAGRLKDLLEGMANNAAQVAGAVGSTPLTDAVEAAVVVRWGKLDENVAYVRSRGWRLDGRGVGWRPPTGSTVPAGTYPLASAVKRQCDVDVAPFRDLLAGLVSRTKAPSAAESAA